MTEDQAAWLERARRGDHRAFRHIVDTHAPALFRVCARITADKALAEDAVQEAFFNAYRHLADFDGRAAFTTWLHRIGVNAALEQLRRRRRHDVHETVEDYDEGPGFDAIDPEAGPERVAHGAQVRREVEALLARMSTIERTAFVLRHHEGQSLEDISAALSLNVNACKQAIFRAVRKLRAVLEPNG